MRAGAHALVRAPCNHAAAWASTGPCSPRQRHAPAPPPLTPPGPPLLPRPLLLHLARPHRHACPQSWPGTSSPPPQAASSCTPAACAPPPRPQPPACSGGGTRHGALVPRGAATQGRRPAAARGARRGGRQAPRRTVMAMKEARASPWSAILGKGARKRGKRKCALGWEQRCFQRPLAGHESEPNAAIGNWLPAATAAAAFCCRACRARLACGHVAARTTQRLHARASHTQLVSAAGCIHSTRAMATGTQAQYDRPHSAQFLAGLPLAKHSVPAGSSGWSKGMHSVLAPAHGAWR